MITAGIIPVGPEGLTIEDAWPVVRMLIMLGRVPEYRHWTGDGQRENVLDGLSGVL